MAGRDPPRAPSFWGNIFQRTARTRRGAGDSFGRLRGRTPGDCRKPLTTVGAQVDRIPAFQVVPWHQVRNSHAGRASGGPANRPDWTAVSALKSAHIRTAGSEPRSEGLDPGKLKPGCCWPNHQSGFPRRAVIWRCVNPVCGEELGAQADAVASRSSRPPADPPQGLPVYAARRYRPLSRAAMPTVCKGETLPDHHHRRRSFTRKQRIDAEAQLDGIYIVRSNLKNGDLSAENGRLAYPPGQVEKAFRQLKTGQLEVYLRLFNPTRVRAHVCACSLTIWHMRRDLAPLPGSANPGATTGII